MEENTSVLDLGMQVGVSEGVTKADENMSSEEVKSNSAIVDEPKQVESKESAKKEDGQVDTKEEDFDKRQKELDERESQIIKRELELNKDKIKNKLESLFSKSDMSSDFVEPLLELGLNEDKIMGLAENLSEAFKKAVEARVGEKLVSKSPKSSEGTVGKEKSMADIFATRLRR